MLWKVEKYLKVNGIAPTTFGRKCAGDPRLVSDLRCGRDVGVKMSARIDAFIAGQRP